MQDIDFLPVQYRQRRAQRRAKPWQIVVVGGFVGLVVLAGVVQYQRRLQTERELAQLAPHYDAAVFQQQHLAEIRSRLKTLGTSAELYTYLRHPWPRTQLLAALATPLPDEITLLQLQIARQALPARPAPDRTPPSDKGTESNKVKSQTPAERDLQRFHEQRDGTQTVVTLVGTTTDSAALHRYLGQLDGSPLFAKAEMTSFSAAADNREAVMQFHATLIVRPGYGQPGGPTPLAGEKNTLAQGGRALP